MAGSGVQPLSPAAAQGPSQESSEASISNSPKLFLNTAIVSLQVSLDSVPRLALLERRYHCTQAVHGSKVTSRDRSFALCFTVRVLALLSSVARSVNKPQTFQLSARKGGFKRSKPLLIHPSTKILPLACVHCLLSLLSPQ